MQEKQPPLFFLHQCPFETRGPPHILSRGGPPPAKTGFLICYSSILP